MSETKLRIIKVGSYSQSKSADPQDCKVCHDAKWGTVIIEGVCTECLLAELSKYKWIPVETRLPENNDDVVCLLYDQCAVGYWSGKTWLDNDDHQKFCMQVTHWLPLPPPPEREK